MSGGGQRLPWAVLLEICEILRRSLSLAGGTSWRLLSQTLGLQSLWGSWPSPVGQFLGDLLGRYVTFQGNVYQVPRTFLCDYFGEPVGKSCKLSGDLGKFLWEFFGEFAKSLGDLDQVLGEFLTSSLGKFLWGFANSLGDLAPALGAFLADSLGKSLRGGRQLA